MHINFNGNHIKLPNVKNDHTHQKLNCNYNGSVFAQALAVSLSTQDALWQKFTTDVHNIANSSTAGFKDKKDKISQVKKINNNYLVPISFAQVKSSVRNNDIGAFKQTGNPLDTALRTKGYFMVKKDNQNFLTRNGQFQISLDGILVTAHGGFSILDDAGGEIALPKESIKNLTINANGEIYSASAKVGKIGVFNIKDEQDGLINVGDNLLKTNETPEIAKKYNIQQYGTEESSVSAVKESTEMISTLRSFEYSQKVIDELDKMGKSIINVSARSSV